MSGRRRRRATGIVGAVAVVAGIGGAEALHWCASRWGRTTGPRSGTTGVIVLGYPSRRDGRVHPVQRWRVAIAGRSAPPDTEGPMVFTGGARPGARSEAEAMAAWAMTTGIPGRVMRIEDQSRSTRENVRFALPLVENCGTVVFASDPMHAARARRYAIEQRPDLADRLAVGDDYRFLERWWWKVPTAAYELWISGRDRLRARRAPRP